MIILSFLIITSYVVYSIYKNGIPKSLSATYYNNKGWFSLAILSSVILIYPKMFEITPDNLTLLPFLILAGVGFVAVAPNFKSDNIEDSVHTTAAIIAFIASQLWILLLYPMCLILWILFLFIRNNRKFWAEIIMLLTIYLSLFYEFIWK